MNKLQSKTASTCSPARRSTPGSATSSRNCDASCVGAYARGNLSLAQATVRSLAVRWVCGSSSSSTLRRKAIRTIMRCMASESRRSQMLRGVLDLCLLAVVVDEPAYGYEMTKRLRERGLSIVGEGSIYPLLGRLEREGLVDTYRAASDGGPPRKYYRPSSAGRLALAMGVSEWRAARDAVDAVLAPVRVEVAS